MHIRQRDLVSLTKLSSSSVDIIGVGSVGSFAALALGKLGVGKIRVFDEQGVGLENIPVQFYKNKHADESPFKVDALEEILDEFTKTKYKGINKFYTNQKLSETVILCTDNMENSRWKVFEQFKKQPQCHHLIDSRMGAEMMLLYTIRSKSKSDLAFYGDTLHTDAEASELPCTGRTIIYNVLVLAGLIGRAYKSIIRNEKDFPREIVFDMTRFDKLTSLMLRQ